MAAPVEAAALAQAALARFPVAGDARLHLVRHGENTTYRVDASDGRSFALRLHRPGYHSVAEIAAEIAWIDALRAAGVETPEPIRGNNDDPVQRVGDVADRRTATMFRWVDGKPLSNAHDASRWSELGELVARVHEHGRTWRRPRRFRRASWDSEALVGERPRWGEPDSRGAFSSADRVLLSACRDEVRRRLAAIGMTPDRYGLIHGDLGFENVLIARDGRPVVIDFDDCGEGWFAYELAVVLYPHEGILEFEERRQALIAGYRRAATLADEVADELPTFLMARRLATLGWVFSRAETDHARAQSAVRLSTTPAAARRFLAWARDNDVR